MGKYVAPSGSYESHSRLGWWLLSNAISDSQVDFGGFVLQEAAFNARCRHCRIGRITLKEAK